MYRLQVSHPAHKQIADLPPELAARINEEIAKLVAAPRPRGTKKLTGREGYRVRVGDYRVLYRINDRDQIVVVTRVKHRGEAYR